MVPDLQRLRHRKDLPPTPRLPIGAQDALARYWPFRFFDACRARLGPRFTLHTISRPPLVFLADREEVRQLLTAPADLAAPGQGGQAVQPIVGPESLMVLDGDEHLSLRRALAPAFKSKLAAEQQQVIDAVVERGVAAWPVDRELALAPRLRALSLEVVLRALFPAEPDRGIRSLGEAILGMMDIAATPLLTEAIYRRGPLGRRRWQRFLRERAEVDRLVFDAIDRHRDAAGQLLRLMLEAGPMSDGQVRDNVMSLVLAGHETTASQLAWTFQLLAHHPDALARLHEEIDSGDGHSYLTATVHESQRRRPVLVFTVPRGIVGDLRIGDWTYRPPAQVVGGTYLLNHDPHTYPEPYRFLPERFLDSPPDPSNWVLWGGGRRVCLGRHLATAEMHAVLLAALARFDVLPTARAMEPPMWRGVLVTPRRHGRVKLRRR